MGGPPPQRACPDPRGSARGQGILSLPPRLLGRLRREIGEGAGLVLILDYDGTLTPIVPSPAAATLAAAPRATLERLARNPRARLAILSGRSLSDVRARVGVGSAVYGGCQGFEIAGAGLRWRHATARTADVRAVARILARHLGRFPGAFLERKGMSVSLHYRNVLGTPRRDLLGLATTVVSRAPGVRTLPGKSVLEFLPEVPWGKGQAATFIARRLARALRPRRTVVVYAGDDASDEAAFAALRGRAVTVRVGAARSLADHAVRNVREIHALLRWLERAIG